MMEKTEKAFLEKVLSRHQGDIGRVACEMGITKRAVYLKLKKLKIEPSTHRPPKN
jgi:transcriptional regulator with PAS, ATPase and Fis domain